VTRHGGTIRVVPAPGGGAHFEFELDQARIRSSRAQLV
jgi:signal transduction histidine kinase